MKANEIFKALGDETRLRILNILASGELCVCDIMEVLSLPQSKVSRHLALLRHAGLVIVRKEGLWVYYSVFEPQTKFLGELKTCLKLLGAMAPYKEDLNKVRDIVKKNLRTCS